MTTRNPFMAEIAREVAAGHRLDLPAFMARTKRHREAHARQEAIWRMRRVYWPGGGHRYSYTMIGRFFGFDHTTCLHGDRAHQDRLDAAARKGGV